ncbi:MAG: polyphosphate kinase 1 [Acidimicrobiia bacterium]|nr:polyphosphate kinase 1 [Acidimicrobiia bacterium]MYE68021.1 polyphosphate kinase 1 [Acidimicrobiia bacterium]
MNGGSPHADPRYLNRELSWLDFDARVVHLAADESIPLLERLRFCVIAAGNLDEFFQVRVASIKAQVAEGRVERSIDGFTPQAQLAAIRPQVEALLANLTGVLRDEVFPALAAEGIRVVDWGDLDLDDRKFLEGEFADRIYPILTPLAVDPGHPFPYLSNLSTSLGVRLADPETARRCFARIKVPFTYGRLLGLPDGERFVPIEQVIAAHLGALFPGMEVLEHACFRVTRNADLSVDDQEAENLLTAVEAELQRRRFRAVVRLEMDAAASAAMRNLLMDELDVMPDDVYSTDLLLDVGGLAQFAGLKRPELLWPKRRQFVPAPLQPTGEGTPDFFAAIRNADVLAHHPYDSFGASVQEFIGQAAQDPHVLAIKMTLYRTDGDGDIVEALVSAAERGKQVAVVVELKARFDELANIGWARQLESAGVHVAYGLVGLKVHAKVCLVVRAEPDGLRRYCHVGTGNYNALTARVYEDLGLLTADEHIGADLSHLFNRLTGYGHGFSYRELVVAPEGIRPRLAELIAAEAAHGASGRIILKLNSLVDAEIIDALYAASAAGVRIDLLVRGICCLRPGVRGLSETISVRSVVGRYLEHSRIYFFGNADGGGRPVYLIGSADLMPRNLNSRVEAIVPVHDPRLQRRLQHILDTSLAERARAWTLHPDGTWEEPRPGTDSPHDTLHEVSGVPAV